ncbi:ubinuclein-1-like isoform X3 [Tripterygium wilfordii]|uniref:ubinuclein-1-like isoform X3 n=1 Tax=Tripterygium wilfordii TaxID=458696 RepID=UPI0018F7E561|nr:ubinuclein-1-like isoform X3 [Tripterygium wilfordii]
MGDERSNGGESSRVQPTCLRKGDRQLFSVELRPGETTFVSWRKLVKDASKGSGSAGGTDTPANAPNLESLIAPAQLAESTEKDAPHPHRFSAVIEKIERLYTGKDSSDEEDLMDIPDDDQYDTEDSFIDDAELDEYFEVDNSAIKHDGFFVNRGKLERINQTVVIPHQQPKKRRRKDSTKALGEDGDGCVNNKPAKVSKAAAAKSAPLLNNSYAPSQNLAVNSGHHEEMKSQNQLNAFGNSSKKKAADNKRISDPSPYLNVPNGGASASYAHAKDIETPKAGVVRTKNPSSKLKDASGSSDASHKKYYEKSAYSLSKMPSGKPLNNNEVELSFRLGEKNGIRELSHANVVESESSMQIKKTSHVHKKDGSSFRSKSSMLEKAIGELQKIVAESRPPAFENQEVDASSHAMKRTRLSREIKLKLAKVARLAQASQGKISKELINRLMSILGHIVQLRTLKRNLKVMISMGLSAKQEKDHRFQHLKKEVVEMIKMHVPSLESKALERQAGASDDFQEVGSEGKGVNKRKFRMNAAMEEKICDLYDLFIDGLDDESGPRIRKLYSECVIQLAELWPNGFMDNHGIKRAICRAKERRRALYTRHKETIKKKNMLVPRPEEAAKVDTGSIAQSQGVRDRLDTDHEVHVSALPHKPVSNITTAAVQTSPSMCAPNLSRPKSEKSKGSLTHSMGDAKMPDGALAKKKVKRKPEPGLDGTHPHPEKLHTQSDERHKPLKLPSILPQKSDKRHKSLKLPSILPPKSVLPQKSVLPLAAPSGLNSQADHAA